MLDIQLNSTTSFKKILDAIEKLIDDVPFECSEQGISLEAMDASHVALISLKLTPSYFKQYRCDRTYQIGLNMKSLEDTFRQETVKENECSIRVVDGDLNSVNFLFNDPARTKVRKVRLSRTTVAFDSLGIRDSSRYSATIVMSSFEFSKLMSDLIHFTDKVTISVDKDGVTFYGRGDTEEIEVVYNGRNSIGSDFRLSFQMNEVVASRFSLKYLVAFSKSVGISSRVKLSMTDGKHPMVVEYKMDEDAGYLRFYLSSCVDEDDMF